jgi:hypothetical protein
LVNALRSLRRAVATLRSYPSGNELSERALRDLAARIAPALPARLLLGSGVLSEPEGAELPIDEGFSALVVDLYRDGVRELRLDARLARPELDRFVAALAAPLDGRNLAEDYVTRLWEAELPNVGVVALDPYLDREIPGDVLEGKARPTGEVEGVPANLPGVVPAPPEAAFHFSGLDRQLLASEVERAKGDPPWRAFLAVLSEVAASPVAGRRKAELETVIESGLYRLMSDGQLALAAELLRRMLAGLPSGALRDVIGRASLEERLAPVRVAVENGPSAHAPARELCALLGAAALPSLLAFLRAAGNAGARKFWAETIGSHGPSGLDSLEETLGEPDAEIAACAARVLAATGEARFARAVWEAFSRSSGTPRRELLRSAARLEAASAKLAEIATSDPDADCRLIALGGLEVAANPALEAKLLARLGVREAVDLSERETDAIYRALAAVGDGAAIEHFEKQLSSSWFTRADRAVQARAARALSRMASPRARELLRERAAGSGAIAQLCRRALGEKPGAAS